MMKCPKCNYEAPTGSFCPLCGEQLVAEEPAIPTPEVPVEEVPVAETPVAPVPVVTPTAPITEDQLPEQYKPVGAWGYFGLQILFALPIIGFIFLIVFSCSSGNINRRNFARSYWCSLLIIAILAVVVAAFALLLGMNMSALM